MALPGTWYKAFLEGPAGAEQQQGKGWHEAPVLFVHMPRDAHTAARVKECVELRQTKVCLYTVIGYPSSSGLSQSLPKADDTQLITRCLCIVRRAPSLQPMPS